MVRQSFVLDPNAAAYTNDEIVGKVNAAAVAITRADAIDGSALGAVDSDDITEGTANKYDTGAPPADLDALPDGTTRKAMSDTEKTKLGGVEEGATVDQTGAEVRDLIVALSDTERKFIMTEPVVGEFPIITMERKADGKTNVQYDDVPIE